MDIQVLDNGALSELEDTILTWELEYEAAIRHIRFVQKTLEELKSQRPHAETHAAEV